MGIIINNLLNVVDALLGFVLFVIFVMVVMSWLVVLGVLPLQKYPVLGQLYEMLSRLTEPILAPIRRYIPTYRGVDFSPLVLILLIYFLRGLISDTVGYS